MQTLRAPIQVVALELLGGRVSAGRVIHLVEELDVLDVNGGHRAPRGCAERCASNRADRNSRNGWSHVSLLRVSNVSRPAAYRVPWRPGLPMIRQVVDGAHACGQVRGGASSVAGS